MDVVPRAFLAAHKGLNMNTFMFNITLVLFRVRVSGRVWVIAYVLN